MTRESSGWRTQVVDALWLLLWGVASSVWAVTAAGELGATFDEPIYVAEGLHHWRSGSTTGLMRLGTMPLPVDVQTFPLYVWERWRGTPIDPVAELPHVLPYARAGTLLFWWLLLIHVGLAARALGGRTAAALAVAFLACEPVLAAHAGLATTDVAVAACLVALAYHFRQQRTASWGRRIAWPAFWFGLSVLAKASGLVFGAILLFFIEADRCGWWRRRSGVGPPSSLRASLRDLRHIGLLGMVLVFVYCGSDWRPHHSFVDWAGKLPERPTATVMVWLADHLRIFSNAGEGIIRQVTHNVRGHGVYLLGTTAPRYLWYYFPVLMTIKFTVPILLAPLGLIALRRWHHSRGPWYGNWALLCAFVLLVFTPFCRVQIGVRFMFPLFALSVIGIAASLARAVEGTSATVGRRRLVAAVVGLCLAWTVGEALAVWPDGLCYVNRAWGGTQDGYRLTSEANYDWGQGAKELRHWLRQHAPSKMYVWYFGTDPAVARLPVQNLPFDGASIRGPKDALAFLRGRRLAVSTTLLYGNFDPPGALPVLEILRDRQPVDRTTTFLIYDFTNEGPPDSARADAAGK